MSAGWLDLGLSLMAPEDAAGARQALTPSALCCDRCGAEPRRYHVTSPRCGAGEECEEVISERYAPPLRDNDRPCGGHYRTAKQLALILAARAEAVALVRSHEDLRMEAEAPELLRAFRAADLIPDVERDGSLPLIYGPVPAGFSPRMLRRPTAGSCRLALSEVSR